MFALVYTFCGFRTFYIEVLIIPEGGEGLRFLLYIL